MLKKTFKTVSLTYAVIATTLWLGFTMAEPIRLKKRYWDDSQYQNPKDTLKKKYDSLRRNALRLPFTNRSERYGDPFSPYSFYSRPSRSPLTLGYPKNYRFQVALDSSKKNVNISEKIGNLDYRPSSQIDLENYQRIRFEEMQRAYWKSLQAERNSGLVRTSGGIFPVVKVPKGLGAILGSDEINIQPVGNVVLDFGGRWQYVGNPQLPRAQQSNFGFVFDQQISFNLTGKIGEFIPVNINWDTKSMFQFENLFKIGYQAKEEDIIQELRLGNVSMPVSNSLITGAQNLFGVQSRLRFGKLWINGVASQQRGTAEQLVIRGGAQGREFEIRSDQYQYNQHFFLSHFFRENYERALRTTPTITSGVIITRVEVYITNRNNNTQTLRNVLGLMDLAEGRPSKKESQAIGNGKGGVADNKANTLFENLKKNTAIRDVSAVSPILETGDFRLDKGADYEILRGARKLTEREFTFHHNLGYVSLITPLRNDEIIAVAYEYTYNGKNYKVGELTNDYQDYPSADLVYLKMLKPSTIRTDLPTWDLMMKNIYSLQTNQLERNNFQLRVIYRDDATGIDNPNLQEGNRTKDVPLVKLMNLDRLNQNNDPQPDGNFDFAEGITIDPLTGRIIFPVLEPFGKHLEAYFDGEREIQLINKYVFNELYRKTQADAQLFTNKSKFFIKGSFQSSSSAQIALPGINISPNSVMIRAGGMVLQEGKDYTVDYQSGRVNILNQSIMSSGKEIVIQYERSDLFNFQTRTLVGFDAEYRVNKDLRFTATLMNLNERPNFTRVNLGTEPTNNMLWGLGVNYRGESRFLTKLIDKIPGVNTKAPSNITFRTDFAQLVPGANSLIAKDGGTSFIDDFEASEIPYDLGRIPINWVLGAVPKGFLNNAAIQNKLEANYKRARLAWYTIDNTAFFQTSGFALQPPANLSETDKQNHYVRNLPFDEIFKGRDRPLVPIPEITLDLAYYPSERAQYNYNPNLLANGNLPNPRENFGAITRAVSFDVDFDNINVQYIEFWLLDPFIKGTNGRVITKESADNNTTGGELQFHLGNISEDVIPDGRHGFENGLPANEATQDTTATPYGVVTTQQFLTNAFSAEDGARARQDVGMDGLNDEQERVFFQSYLNSLQGRLSSSAFAKIQADPSADNFRYYLGTENDQQDLKILDRYRYFNGQQGNSPENAGTAASTTLPDNEDLNRDNTLNDLESYYEYKVDLKPDLQEASKYITNKVAVLEPNTNETVTWYQFRIPIREFDRKSGNIEGFKSIRFVRMMMTGWQQPVVLRMAQFQMVSTQWRPYVGSLEFPGLNTPTEPYDPSFTVSSVNIEENGSIYAIPPGFIRDRDITSLTNARLNEQSLRMCVTNMKDRDTRAVFKNITLDLVNYKRLKMFLHAESDNAKDGEVTAFMRFGTDFKDNYYEIEVPLVMTPIGTLPTDPRAIWPLENEVDIEIADLVGTKTERNSKRLNLNVPYRRKIGQYLVTVVGNPDLSSVQTLMLGVRNPESPDGDPKSVCIWANELRAAGFNSRSGWAVSSQLNLQLADLATVAATLRYTTPFFGGIQDKIAARSRSHDLMYDISSNIQLDKIQLHKYGFSLPLFIGYERRLNTPYFNPLDPDTPLETALETYPKAENPDFANIVRDEIVRKSINLTNARKNKVKAGAKKNIWDFENLSFNLAYNEMSQSNARIAIYEQRNTRIGVAYDYASTLPPFTPFKKSILFDTPYLKFIKDFNLNLLPNSISIRGDIERRFTQLQFRNADLNTLGVTPNFEKSFTFTRIYNIRWNISQNLAFDYNARAYSIIDEPEGELNTQVKKDSVWNNILNFGRMKNFAQQLTVNYKLPFDKFPITDWINGDVKYASDYSWLAGAVGISDTLGNNAQNKRDFALNGQLNFDRLYNKSAFLRKIQDPKSNAIEPVAGEAKQRRLKARIDRKEKVKKYHQEKYETRKKEEEAADTAFVSRAELRRFNRKIERIKDKISDLQDKITILTPEGKQKRIDRQTKKLEQEGKDLTVKFEQKLKKGKQQDSLKIIRLKMDSSLQNRQEVRHAERIKKFDDKIKSLNTQLAEVSALVKQRQAEQKQTNPSMAATGIGQLLLMVKKVNFSFTDNSQTILPGLLSSPNYFGIDQRWESPRWDYVVGGQDYTMKDYLSRIGRLALSESLNNAFTQTRQETLTVRANLMPFPDFDLQIEAKRSINTNYSEVFVFNQQENRHISQSANRSGGYKISFFSLSTMFAVDDAANNSPIFNDFIRNRNTIKQRLDAQNANGTYELNSQDVLLPSFLAAYSGKQVGSQALNGFPQIPMPNWNLSYNGLTKIAALRKHFRSIQIRHAYSSEYAVGSYTSSLLYNDVFLNLNVQNQAIPMPFVDPETGKIAPVLIMDQVSITEAFNPLIGIDIKTIKNLSASLKFNKQRGIALQMSNTQITEVKNTDVTFDVGYTKSNFKIPFKIGGKQHILKNDLTFRMTFTLRDSKTTQRKIEDDVQKSTVTQGNLNIQFRPNISYAINQKATLNIYYDHNLNQPYISNSFPRTVSQFGVQVRFAL